MTKLDYEQNPPLARRADVRDLPQIAWWAGSCIVGSGAGAATALIVGDLLGAFEEIALDVEGFFLLLGICGVLGSLLGMLSAAAILMFVNRGRLRLGLSCLVAFVLTGALTGLLIFLTN